MHQCKKRCSHRSRFRRKFIFNQSWHNFTYVKRRRFVQLSVCNYSLPGILQFIGITSLATSVSVSWHGFVHVIYETIIIIKINWHASVIFYYSRRALGSLSRFTDCILCLSNHCWVYKSDDDEQWNDFGEQRQSWNWF